MNKFSTSIIIRTKNEERWIGHAIQSVLDNISKPEIIIVDNNSTDKTIKEAKKHGVEVFLERKKGKGNVVKRMFSDTFTGIDPANVIFFILFQLIGAYLAFKINNILSEA